MGTEIGILLLLVSGSAIEAVPTLTIQPAAPNAGSTLTLTCERAGFTTDLMNFNKDGTSPYTCALGGQTCDDNGGISDYSEVDWSQTYKGIITLSNADQTRDGGDWTCVIGGVGGGTSVAVTLEITDANCGNPTKPTNGQVSVTTTTYQSTATYSCDSGYTIDGTATTTCQADGTWSGSMPTCAVTWCSTWVIIGIIISIYGTLWILAIVDLLVIYCTDQERLPWNLCDGLLKNRWIWLLLFIVVPFVPFVVSIWLITKRPGKPITPVIYPKSVSVNVGGTAKFTCISSSTTYPAKSGLAMIYTWRHNTVDMKSEGPYMVCGQTLIVTKVVKENASDTFTCIAREENGPPSDESDSAIIVIIAKPTWWTKPGNYGESEQSMPLLPFNE